MMLGALFAALVVVSTAPAAVPSLPNVAVPMRDGVALRCDVFLPTGAGPFPTLVNRTPYDRRGADDATIVAKAIERGYAVVVVDVRGRYGSEGEFDAYRNEGRDGYDTIEWIAKQPWSNGSIGTYGLSYPGAVQWLAAVESPPHLKAMVPAMTFSTPRNFFYSGGVFDLSWIPWIWNNIAPDVRVKKSLAGPRTVKEAEGQWERLGDGFRRRRPLRALAELRDVAPFYFTWLDHQPKDPWWDWAEIRGKYDKVTAAVLNLSGWHDEAYGPEGAITNYLGLVASRGGPEKARAHLVLGPWSHGVPSVAKTRFGEREMGPDAAIDYDALLLRFFDHYVRGADNGFEREPPVRAYVMGEGRWITAPTWPPPNTKNFTLHLSAGKGSRGVLTAEPPLAESETHFVSDPRNPVVDRYSAAQGGHDYRYLLDRRDVAVYESAPLPRDVRVVGATVANIALSADAPDTDLWAKLQDVAPDGTAYNLMNPGLDVLRASYVVGHPLAKDQIVNLRFETLLTGNRFAAGHRVRLVLTTSFFPHFSENMHTGLSEADSNQAQKATIRIHHGPRALSRIEMPVVED